MALDELFQAMNMFKEGAQQLGVARGIQAAQDQVAQVNANITDEIQKRSALEDIGRNLALNMGKVGAPVAQIQSATGAIMPEPIKTANEANLQGLLHPGAAGESLRSLVAPTQQKFEEDPKQALERLKGVFEIEKARQQGAIAAGKLEAKQNAADLKRVTEFGKWMDPTGPRSGEYGKLAARHFQGERLDALLQQGDNLPRSKQGELALGLYNMISGSNAAHVEQVKEMLPSSALADSQKFRNWLFGTDTGLHNQTQIATLRDTLQREKAVNAAQFKTTAYRRAQDFEDIRDSNPAAFERKIRKWGLTPEEYDLFQANGGQLPDTTQQAPQPQATGGVGPGSVTRPSIFNYQVK